MIVVSVDQSDAVADDDVGNVDGVGDDEVGEANNGVDDDVDVDYGFGDVDAYEVCGNDGCSGDDDK